MSSKKRVSVFARLGPAGPISPEEVRQAESTKNLFRSPIPSSLECSHPSPL